MAEAYDPKDISAIVIDEAFKDGTYEDSLDSREYRIDKFSEQNMQYFGWFKIPVYLDEIVYTDKENNGLSEGDKLSYNFRFVVGGRNMYFSFEDHFHSSEGLYATCVYTDLPESKCVTVADFNQFGETSSLIYQTTELYREKVGSLFEKLSSP